MKKRILILGCTGSIGSQTIDIVRKMNDQFSICGLAVGKNKDKLSSLCKEFNCKGTVFSDKGIDGIRELIESCDADIVVNGIAGSAGRTFNDCS